jgi:hypothetical protein
VSIQASAVPVEDLAERLTPAGEHLGPRFLVTRIHTL